LDSDGSLSAKGMKPKETEQKQRLVRFTDLFKKKRRCCFLTFPIDTQYSSTDNHIINRRRSSAFVTLSTATVFVVGFKAHRTQHTAPTQAAVGPGPSHCPAGSPAAKLGDSPLSHSTQSTLNRRQFVPRFPSIRPPADPYTPTQLSC